MLKDFQRPVLGIALAFILSLTEGCSPDATVQVAHSDGEISLPSPQVQSEPLPDSTPSPTSALSSSGESADLERIRAVLAQLAAKRQGITSYTMDISWERREFPETPIDAPLPEGTVIAFGEGTWMVKGDMWRVHRKKRWERKERPSEPGVHRPRGLDSSEPYESWSVYNGQYYANYRSGLSITLYPRVAIEAGIVQHEPDLYPFPLQWGFGSGTPSYLDETFESIQDPVVARWSLSEFQGDDGPKIKITFYNGEAKLERTLDPQRDFLIVEAAAWTVDGELFIRKSMKLQQLADGRWFPKEVIEHGRDTVKVFKFTDVEFNPQILDTEFYIESFDIDYESTYLIQRTENGGGTSMLFREGQWIPKSLVPKHLRPEKDRETIRVVRGQIVESETER